MSIDRKENVKVEYSDNVISVKGDKISLNLHVTKGELYSVYMGSTGKASLSYSVKEDPAPVVEAKAVPATEIKTTAAPPVPEPAKAAEPVVKTVLVTEAPKAQTAAKAEDSTLGSFTKTIGGIFNSVVDVAGDVVNTVSGTISNNVGATVKTEGPPAAAAKPVEAPKTDMPTPIVLSSPVEPALAPKPVEAPKVSEVKVEEAPAPGKEIASGEPEIKYPKTRIEISAIEEVMEKYNNAKMPKGETVTVCSGYGCTVEHQYKFEPRLWDGLKSFFVGIKTPAEERRAIALAIGFCEQVIGQKTGTQGDWPSMDVSGNGDPGQMDCVDEALNSTSYLILMYRAGLIKFHSIKAPSWKGGLFKWTHYCAVIADETTGVNWAIDSGVGQNGIAPLVIEYNRWYV